MKVDWLIVGADPNDYDITRITEQKYLSGQTSPKTTLVMEYPQAYVPGKNDPYYAILNEENRERLDLYLKIAINCLPSWKIFG
jgi:UDP-galactopyranose mutase